jgi:hypothetical protein
MIIISALTTNLIFGAHAYLEPQPNLAMEKAFLNEIFADKT